MSLEHLKERAIRAHNWTSFDPDKRGKQFIDTHTEFLNESVDALKILGATNEQIQRFKTDFEKKLSEWIGAKSRCMSSAIAGPARFPVEKARKANDTEQRRGQEFYAWVEKVKTAIKRNKDREEKRALNPTDVENKEVLFTGGVVVFNYEENRIQVKHDQKPEQETITAFKKNGYKWSPRFKAWQRQLTDNAIRATENLLNIKLK